MILFLIFITFLYAFENPGIQQQLVEIDQKKQSLEAKIIEVETQNEKYYSDSKVKENLIKQKEADYLELRNLKNKIFSFENDKLIDPQYKYLVKWYKAFKDADQDKLNKFKNKMTPAELELTINFTNDVQDLKGRESEEKLLANLKDLRQQHQVLGEQYISGLYLKQELLNQKRDIELEREKKQEELYSCSGEDEVRLDRNPIAQRISTAGPLQDIPIIDQDGLGTCYANSTALLYKSTFPEQPLLSYLDMAIEYKRNEKDVNYNLEQLKLSGGDGCSTINSISGKEICISEGSLIDNNQVLDFHHQTRLITNASQVIDGLKHKMDKDLSGKLIKNSEKFISMKPFEEYHYSSQLLMHVSFLDNFLEKIPKVPENQEQYNLFKTQFNYFIRSTYPDKLVTQEISNFTDLKKLFYIKFKDYGFALKEFENNLEQYQQQFLEDQKQLTKIKSEWSRMPENNQTYMQALGINECLSQTQFLNLFTYLDMIKALNHDIDLVVFDLLKEENTDYDVLKKLIHPKCKTHKVSQNIKCRDLAHQNKNQLRYEVLSNLYKDKPKAVGISYCSNVLENPNYLDYKKKRSCAGVMGQSMHASVIIGARKNPDKNECEYLIQNSWGAGCEKYYDPKKCEHGKIWISEESLFNNLQSTFVIH